LNVFFTSLERDALLHIVGPDALTFLQGQTTCDTRTVDTSHAIPGLHCTPQGRVLADFLLLLLDEDHVALRLRRDILDVTAASLGKYIVFSKAELASDAQGWSVHACWGEDAAAALETVLGQAPDGLYRIVSGPGYRIVQVDEQRQAFECLLDDDSALAAGLAAACKPAEEVLWEAGAIRRGLARIEAATSGEFVPQMLNYDLTGHISFNKGCYTGQEVVARLHYRGKPKRRAYIADFPGAAPAPGTELFLADQAQNAGQVINAAATGDGNATVLVTATEEAVNRGLAIAQPGPAELSLSAPPYSREAD
jgi:folate-binding protein YgfZ